MPSNLDLPEELTKNIDIVRIGELVPGGIVKDTVHLPALGYTYPYRAASDTHSTVVRYVIQTGSLIQGAPDGSVYVVDIGGNCGFCRAYIPAGDKKSIMFGWEIEGCPKGTLEYTFESSRWYAVEQGRVRVLSGIHAGKDYVYLKIDGELISSFYGEPDSRPPAGAHIYIEATNHLTVLDYRECRVRYHKDGKEYLDRLSQIGFPAKEPPHPEKSGHYFMGWFTENGLLYDFKAGLTGDLSLYARYTSESVRVTFDPANGQPSDTVTAGKGCLVPRPSDPVYTDERYPYTFTGWKNENTGALFDFSADRLTEDTLLTARYRETEFYAAYYASGRLIKKVGFVRSHPTVSGLEPPVPEIPNTAGRWDPHPVNGLTDSFTVRAVYDADPPPTGTGILPETYAGEETDLCTGTVRRYLSAPLSEQTAFVRAFCASPHGFHDRQHLSFIWHDSRKNKSYTVYFADNAAFRRVFTVLSDKPSLTDEVGFFTPGKTYYWFVYGNEAGNVSPVDSFTVSDRPVRPITAGAVTNMRDAGGYPTEEGKRVRYGMVYRGGSLDEYHSRLDEEARKVFFYLGIRSEIELRGEAVHAYTGWDEYNPRVTCIRGAGYVPVLTPDEEQKAQYRTVFEAMAKEENYPFYFHCSAGADRTGSFGYLLGGLLGVRYEDLRRDYELSSFSEVGLRTADLFMKESFDEMHRLMLSRFGDASGSLQAAVRNFLTEEIGVGLPVIEKIKGILLV